MNDTFKHKIKNLTESIQINNNCGKTVNVHIVFCIHPLSQIFINVNINVNSSLTPLIESNIFKYMYMLLIL